MNFFSRFTFVATTLLSVIAPLPAQLDSAAQGPIVKKIDVQYVGPESMTRERVLSNLATQVGQPYSERTIEQDIRSLYATGTLANVRMFGEPFEDGVKVTVLLQGRPIVAEVLIEGAEVISQIRLRREISVKPPQSLSEEKIEDDRRKILKLYNDRNYADVDVQYKVEDLKDNKVRVIFSITEGPKLIVKKITFIGNDSVKDKDLRAAMKTKVRSFIWFLDKSGRLVSTQLEEDRAALRLLYQNRGFADVEITDISSQPLENRKDGVEVIVTIQEGIQYHVNTIQLEGVNLVPTDQMMAILKMREGSLLTPKGMGDDLNAMRTFYGQRGYIEANPMPQVTPAGQGAVDILYRVDEGVQSYVNLVNIQGNSRTKDRVLRNELVIKPGDVYDTTLVEVSKKRLEGLNYFSNVSMSPSDTVVPGRKDLNIIVEEKRTGSFNFGAGFSTIDSLIGFAEIQQTNFDLFDWPHFVGGGQRFRLRLQYGLQRSDFTISWTEPYLFGYKLQFGVEGFYHQANFLSAVYNQSNLGAAFELQKSLTKSIRATGEYRVEQIRIYDVNSSQVGKFIEDSAGTYVKSAISGALDWDTRDDLFLTRKGAHVRFGGFISGGPLGGTVNDYGIRLQGEKYFSLPWDSTLMFKGELSVVDTLPGNSNGTMGVPIFDRLYLGGANTLRGFDFRDVGPKDSHGNPIGGNSLAYATVEYGVPIIPRVRGYIFGDMGFVNGNSYDFSTSSVNADIGLGLRVELPIGPIRIDYGIPVLHDQYNGGTGKFNFNVGYQF